MNVKKPHRPAAQFMFKMFSHWQKETPFLLFFFGNNGKLVFCWLIPGKWSDFLCRMRSPASEISCLLKLTLSTLECVDDWDSKNRRSWVKGLTDDCFLMMAQGAKTAFYIREGRRGRAWSRDQGLWKGRWREVQLMLHHGPSLLVTVAMLACTFWVHSDNACRFPYWSFWCFCIQWQQ